jgi:hypothetical protein
MGIRIPTEDIRVAAPRVALDVVHPAGGEVSPRPGVRFGVVSEGTDQPCAPSVVGRGERERDLEACPTAVANLPHVRPAVARERLFEQQLQRSLPTGPVDRRPGGRDDQRVATIAITFPHLRGPTGEGGAEEGGDDVQQATVDAPDLHPIGPRFPHETRLGCGTVPPCSRIQAASKRSGSSTAPRTPCPGRTSASTCINRE